MIELKDFIKETLKQVIDGVIAAQEYGTTKGAAVNPGNFRYGPATRECLIDEGNNGIVQPIAFDVAVTNVEENKIKGGIGVFVGPVGFGSQGQSGATNSSVSRIAFSVPVGFPTTATLSEEQQNQQKKEAAQKQEEEAYLDEAGR